MFKTDLFNVENLPVANGVVVGMDLSLTETGITAISNGKAYCSTLKPLKDVRGIERLDWFDGQFAEMLEHYKPDAVAIENYAYMSHKGVVLGELGALGRLNVWRRHIPLYLVSPNGLKKFATGKGRSPKGGIIKEVYKRWGIDTNNENVADSAVLAVIAYYKAYPGKAQTTAFQTEVMAKVGPITNPSKESPPIRKRAVLV